MIPITPLVGSPVELMLQHALDDGLRVVYCNRTMVETVGVFRRLEELNPVGLTKVRRAHGSESAEFASGGRIRFIACTKNSFRGCIFDVAILDGVENKFIGLIEPSLASSPRPAIYYAPPRRPT